MQQKCDDSTEDIFKTVCLGAKVCNEDFIGLYESMNIMYLVSKKILFLLRGENSIKANKRSGVWVMQRIINHQLFI